MLMPMATLTKRVGPIQGFSVDLGRSGWGLEGSCRLHSGKSWRSLRSSSFAGCLRSEGAAAGSVVFGLRSQRTVPVKELGFLGQEQTTRPAPTIAKALSVKLKLLGSPCTVSRQHPTSQCLLLKLGLLGQEQMGRTAPTSQQSQWLLVKVASWNRQAECHDALFR